MKSYEFIRRLPVHTQAVIAKSPYYADAGLAEPDGSAISLERLVGDEGRLIAIYASMSELEKHTLERVVKRFGPRPFEMHQLEKQNHEMSEQTGGLLSGAELKVGLAGLRRHGILFALRKSWGEYLYVLPTDTYAIWLKLLAGNPVVQPEELNALTLHWRSVTVTDQPKRSLEQELFYTLVWIASKGLPVTQKGMFNKKGVQRLAEQMALKEKDCVMLASNAQLQYCNDSAVGFVCDVLFQLELAEQAKDAVIINPAAICEWMRLSPEQMRKELHLLYARMYAASGLEPLAFAAANGLGTDWTPVRRLLDWHRKNGLSTEIEEDALLELIFSWLRQLASFGWAELGYAPAEEGHGRIQVFRYIAPLMEAGKKNELFVQPDFEIIVPPGVSYFIQWELELIGERNAVDHAVTYRLTKDSIQRAVRNGRTLHHIEALLTANAKYGVPDNVLATVREWVTQQDEMNGVSSQNPYPNLNELHHSASGRGKYFNEINSQVMKAIVYTKCAVQYYDIETKFPSLNEIYPEYDALPSAWLKDCRTYHHSTRKQLIQKAIEWRTHLKLRMSGNDIKFVPTRLHEQSGAWSVSGMLQAEERNLMPDEWEEMQLVLPGINEKG